MLQQTRVAAVLPRYTSFISRFPDVYSLSVADEDVLKKHWEGLGYYSRAVNLKRSAALILTTFSGKFPSSEKQLLTLPGIGPYTAAAIASIAFGKPVAAVDGNVLRVWSRLMEDSRNLSSPSIRKEIKNKLESILPAEHPGDFNSAMMELGATVCLPTGKPHCSSCPLSFHCKAYASGSVSQFPVRHQKTARRIIQKTVFVLYTPSGTPLVHRREKKGVLSGLWQFPDLEFQASESEFFTFLAENGLHPEGEILQYTKKHIFTHQEWNMCIYSVSVSGTPPLSWMPLTEEMALPTAYRICIPE